MKKSQLRNALEQVDLIIELQNKSIRQIAAKFGTTTCIIHKVLTEQLQLKIDNRQKEYLKKALLNDEDYLLQSKGCGEWMLSSERRSIREFKKTILK